MKIFQSIWNFIKKIFTAILAFLGWFVNPLFDWKDLAEKRQAQLIATLTLSFGLLNIIGQLSSISMTGWDDSSIVLIILTGFTLIAYGLSRSRYYYTGAQIFIWTWWLGAFISGATTSGGVVGTLNSLLAFVFIMAGALLKIRSLSILVVATFFMFFLLGTVVPGISSVQLYSVVGTSGTVAILILIFTAFRNSQENNRIGEIVSANEALQKANVEISQSKEMLESRVQERTAKLEAQSVQLTRQSEELLQRSEDLEKANRSMTRRAAQLELVSEVARTISSLRDINQLLPQITKLISERFGFYHAGIFLLDDSGEYAVLSAANSEGGQRMLARNHRLKVGQVGIVGYVTGKGEPRIAHDTGTDAVYFNNPDMPNTRSEMAIPLSASNKVIGALDVQSTEMNAFTEEDLNVMKTLADQVSIAIQNARAFEETRRALAEADALYRQNLRADWGRLSREKKLVGFRYTGTGATQLDELVQSPAIKQAVITGNEVLPEKLTESNENVLAVPLKLRDEVIGVLNIRAPENRRWTQDEIDLARAVAERVSISAENARLFEDTTKRAERERMVANITNKIRSTNDPAMMLKTAMDELQAALGVSKVQIAPYKQQPPATNPNNTQAE